MPPSARPGPRAYPAFVSSSAPEADEPGQSAPIACVGAIVFDECRRMLVVQRGRAPAVGRWSIPGGRVEPGESLRQALEREVREETGITVHAGEEVGVVSRPAPRGGIYVIHDLLAVLDDDHHRDPVAGDDATDARWVSRAELVQLPTVDGLIEALTAWQMLPD